jgi:molybdate transport system substrate-binding protein
MNIRWAGFMAAILMFLSPRVAAAQASTVHVLSSVGLKVVIDEMRPQWERLIGHPIDLEFNAAAAIQAKIDGGEVFDFAILPTGLIDVLTKQGKISDGTRVEIAGAGIGVGMRAGGPRPDISTSEALKRALLNAKSITYPENGASRNYIEKMFERLGIANQVEPKIIFQKGKGGAQESVADGKMELVITLISEILPVQGLELVGPLPAQLQHYITFTAGISTNSTNPAAAKALIELISARTMDSAFKAKGLEPPER